MRLAILALGLLFLLDLVRGEAVQASSAPHTITPAPASSSAAQAEQQYLYKRQVAVPTSSVQNSDNHTVVLNVTTVVVVAASGNMSATVLGDGGTGNSTAIEDQLQNNQNALHDMTLVVVLVCSISGAAVLISAIIFAWFKIRKHKAAALKKPRPPGSSLSSLSLSSRSSFSPVDDHLIKTEGEQDVAAVAAAASDLPDQLPASGSAIVIPPQGSGSRSAQPVPSAPTEKELRGPTSVSHHQPAGTASTMIHTSIVPPSSQAQVYQQLDTIPPPAYTPTAPSSVPSPLFLIDDPPLAPPPSSSIIRISLPVSAARAPDSTGSPFSYHDRRCSHS